MHVWDFFFLKKRKSVEIFYLIYLITFGDFYLELLNYHIEMIQRKIRMSKLKNRINLICCNSKSNVNLYLISIYFH